ncbi:DUF6298 domain-containing protein [Aliifodinibius sp. S!AR15-10]|uniref:DUF6298 domain-containing protein n=1 Tax=Aliifodinibius sp. S!AR15-10 TaxID=2950437 RepID=UPI0028563F15|nr:DUF6298 domain-containing protein [Aliifodinibius sp. S!AR15-10]MDR8391949.1 DUF6298 domain-containing protein [Aliifodinibius sp. S!AR15-10]
MRRIDWLRCGIASILVISILSGLPGVGWGQDRPARPISENEQGELVYSKDERGNRIPDFSYAGYMAGEQPIPDVPIRIVVPVKKGDDTRRIQAAIDYVASLPADDQGVRGAVLLEKGTYKVGGHLTLSASGVVLRGSGMGEDGTVLVGAGQSRETLIRIAGINDRKLQKKVEITDPYVPVNAMQFKVAENHHLQQGDRVQVRRPSTEAWIEELDMAEFGGKIDWIGWKPGERDIVWDRTITEVEGNTITIDAPITTALDSAYGSGSIAEYHWPSRIRQVGVENIRLESAYAESSPKDESHRWMAISMENVLDGWVRQVVFEHFAGSAVMIRRTGRRITVEDSKSLNPVSEIGGQRRYTFWTRGQQTLFQRLYAKDGYHDFSAGYLSTLNAFVQCTSDQPHSFSGAINSWASGALFDIVNVDGGALRFFNRAQGARGAGWTAANSMIWQCSASKIECDKPPTAQNWAIGIWAQYYGDGYWGNVNDHVQPRSLYYAQLSDRLGEHVQERANLLPISTKSYTSPTKAEAAQMMAQSTEPPPLLQDWIDRAFERNPIPTAASGVKQLQPSDVASSPSKEAVSPVEMQNGKLVQNGRLLTGKRQGVRWWRGEARPYGAREATPHVTRYVPGQYGDGLTDSLQQVIKSFDEQHIASLDHNYGLWYDRRRDDHQRVRRMNGDVWPPFYELPFERSGEGTAWDGLSKYDLTKYNPWYWNRLGTFADMAEKEGIMLMHQNYFQHNILEAGAHWADFPWRSANNINDTGFPEPPPYAGDKRIFMSKLFYDSMHPVRRPLHQQYIRKCLSNFADNSNVIQLIGAEYTGPIHFTEFWVDTIEEWESDHENDALIGLSVTKDVQDAILADARRSETVDLIDIRYWHYREDGSLYAPSGGEYLAPRQHARLVETGSSSFEQVYRAVREYRNQYPDKAVTYSSKGEGEYGWAVFMAGGSLPRIPEVEDPKFLEDALAMEPLSKGESNIDQWILSNERGEYILYSQTSEPAEFKVADAKQVKISWINPESGRTVKRNSRRVEGNSIQLDMSSDEPVVIWISKE